MKIKKKKKSKSDVMAFCNTATCLPQQQIKGQNKLLHEELAYFLFFFTIVKCHCFPQGMQ